MKTFRNAKAGAERITNSDLRIRSSGLPVLDQLVVGFLIILTVVFVFLHYQTLDPIHLWCLIPTLAFLSHYVGKWMIRRHSILLSGESLTIRGWILRNRVHVADLKSYAEVQYRYDPIQTEDENGRIVKSSLEETEKWKELILKSNSRLFLIRSLSQRDTYKTLKKQLTAGLAKMTTDEIRAIRTARKRKGLSLIALAAGVFCASFTVGQFFTGPLKPLRGTVAAVPSITENDRIHILLLEYPFATFEVSHAQAVLSEFFSDVNLTDRLEINIPASDHQQVTSGSSYITVPVFAIRHNHGTFLDVADWETAEAMPRRLIWLSVIPLLILGFRLATRGSLYGKPEDNPADFL